jgi:nucleoside-diphosphate-sugar epimerase
MMKTRILITGASGFVGSSFCMRFAPRDDVEILGLGRRSTDLPNYIRADLTQPLNLDWPADVVIHAAARSSPWGSLSQFRRHNVLATSHVLDYCIKRRVKKLVYISSSSVFYQNGDQLGMTEESPIGPGFANHYARTKYEGEQIARRFPGACVILRPRAVFGPRDTVLFPRLLRAARQGRMAVITRPAPPAVGDLIYIDTLCDYILRAALDPSVTGSFNLTNNQPVEIQSFLGCVYAQLGLPPVTRSISRDNAMRVAMLIECIYKCFLCGKEPPITRFGVGVLGYSKTFDVSKCLDVMGPPSVSLGDGVAEFIRWQKATWQEQGA